MPLIDTRYGQIEIPDPENDLIGRFLSHYGEWAWDEVEFVASLLSPGARVLDVGAYLGTFGLGLSICTQLASVCFVEANPDITPYLKENVRRLKRQPSHVVGALVVGSDERRSPGRIDSTNRGALSFAKNAEGEPFDRIPEQTIHLSELRELYGPFDLVKLDVEGMELELISSDADFFRSSRCILWTECNETSATLELYDFLLSIDLDIFYFAFPSHNPDNANKATEAIFPLAFEAGLLAGRKLSPALSSTLQAHGCILRQLRTREALREALWATPRWGLRAWDGKSASEIAALAGRLITNQDYNSFLEPKLSIDAERSPGSTFLRHLRQVESTLASYEAVLQLDYAGDNERTIRDLVEREARLRYELAESVELRRLSDETLANTRKALDEREGALRSSEVRLSQLRSTASEYLYQLMSLTPRLIAAEQSAADAAAKLLDSFQQFGSERELWSDTEKALRDDLAVVRQDLADKTRHIELAQERRTPSGIKRYAIYQKFWRPLIRKLRQVDRSRQRRHVSK